MKTKIIKKDKYEDYQEHDYEDDIGLFIGALGDQDQYKDYEEEYLENDAQDFSLVHSVIIAIGSSHWSDPTCQCQTLVVR